jgi:predicted nucleic acid-binding protein
MSVVSSTRLRWSGWSCYPRPSTTNKLLGRILPTHLRRVQAEELLSAELGREAFELAKRYGLAAMDALHIAAAIRQKVNELITSELPGKPLFRVKELAVRSLKHFS